ncbi:MAG: hypothetical protein QW711_04030 [Candidatus Korarchaeum sp.]
MNGLPRSKALRLVDLVIKGEVDRIAPRYDPALGYEYCSALEELGIKCDDAMELIRELVEIGVLRKEVHDRVASCSKCGSEVFLVRAKCPYCGSIDFHRSVAIEHLTCSYVGLESEFLDQRGRLSCPKCRRELKGLGIDSLRVADVYRCGECGEVFSVPSLTHECLKCGYENREVELRPKEVYRYVVVPEGIRREDPVLKLHDAIRSKAHGYEVEGPYAKVRGSSEVELEFSIVIRKPGSEFTVIEVVEDLDRERLLAVFAKAYGVSARDVIVIHRGEVEEAVRSLASRLGVRLLKLGDFDEVAEEVLKSLGGGES